MAYEKQTFQNGQVLSADQLNHIEDGLKAVSDEVDASNGALSAHNTDSTSHNDIRILISELGDRLNAIADSEDIDLDQLSELVAYIKDNRELIDQITTSKVSVTDIVDDLITNLSDRPLSAAQGVALKNLIDEMSVFEIEDGSITPEKTSFIKSENQLSKNLFDKTSAQSGVIVNANGGVIESPNYFTSDFIPVTHSKSYCLSIRYSIDSAIVVAYYSDNDSNSVPLNTPFHGDFSGLKVNMSGTVDGNAVKYIVIGSGSTLEFPEETNYVRFCMMPARLENSIQFETGMQPTSYEDYACVGKTYYLDETIQLPLSDKVNDLESRFNEFEEIKGATKSLSVIIADKAISLIGKLGETQTIQIDGNLAFAGGNDQFNLTSRTISKDGDIQIIDSSAGDDLPPIDINYGGVGGNHHYNFLKCTVTLNGVGLEYCPGLVLVRKTDGVEFLVVDYDEDTVSLVFLPYCTDNADGLPQIANVEIEADDELWYSDMYFCKCGQSSSVRYKSTNHHKYSFIVDGGETTEHKNYNCDTFSIKETYDIISPQGVWDFYESGIDPAVTDKRYYNLREEFPVCMTVENIYTFDGKCSMLVNTTFRAVEKIKIQQAGIIQNYLLAKGTDDLEYMYVNKAFEKDGVNLSSLVNINDLPESTIAFKGTEFGDDGVANRNVLWVTSSTGEKKYGLTTGFIPDLSSSKDSVRKTYLGDIWRVYFTKKSYPYGVRVQILNPGEAMSFLAYRSYLPEEIPVTNFNIVDVGNIAYLFIDAHEAGVYTVEVDAKYHNRVIEILEQKDIGVSSDIVGDSITFNVSSDYGYAVLKLK